MPSTPKNRFTTPLIAGMLTAAVVANLAQLPALETHEWTTYRAFVRSESPSMAAIGLASSPTVREGRGIYLWLSEVAPQVELIVGSESELDEWQLFGLARIDRIRELDVPASELLPDVDLESHMVADDSEGHYGPFPFAIFLADDEPSVLVVQVAAERHELIDVRLLPDEVRSELTQ